MQIQRLRSTRRTTLWTHSTRFRKVWHPVSRFNVRNQLTHFDTTTIDAVLTFDLWTNWRKSTNFSRSYLPACQCCRLLFNHHHHRVSSFLGAPMAFYDSIWKVRTSACPICTKSTITSCAATMSARLTGPRVRDCPWSSQAAKHKALASKLDSYSLPVRKHTNHTSDPE